VLEGVAIHVAAAAHPGVVAAVDQSGQRVIVDGVDRVRQGIAERREVHRVAIALEEEEVAGIDRAYGVVQAPVERTDDLPLDVARLV
jgi:ribosomal protein L24